MLYIQRRLDSIRAFLDRKSTLMNHKKHIDNMVYLLSGKYYKVMVVEERG